MLGIWETICRIRIEVPFTRFLVVLCAYVFGGRFEPHPRKICRINFHSSADGFFGRQMLQGSLPHNSLNYKALVGNLLFSLFCFNNKTSLMWLHAHVLLWFTAHYFPLMMNWGEKSCDRMRNFIPDNFISVSIFFPHSSHLDNLINVWNIICNKLNFFSKGRLKHFNYP